MPLNISVSMKIPHQMRYLIKTEKPGTPLSESNHPLFSNYTIFKIFYHSDKTMKYLLFIVYIFENFAITEEVVLG